MRWREWRGERGEGRGERGVMRRGSVDMSWIYSMCCVPAWYCVGAAWVLRVCWVWMMRNRGDQVYYLVSKILLYLTVLLQWHGGGRWWWWYTLFLFGCLFYLGVKETMIYISRNKSKKRGNTILSYENKTERIKRREDTWHSVAASSAVAPSLPSRSARSSRRHAGTATQVQARRHRYAGAARRHSTQAQVRSHHTLSRKPRSHSRRPTSLHARYAALSKLSRKPRSPRAALTQATQTRKHIFTQATQSSRIQARPSHGSPMLHVCIPSLLSFTFILFLHAHLCSLLLVLFIYNLLHEEYLLFSLPCHNGYIIAITQSLDHLTRPHITTIIHSLPFLPFPPSVPN